MRKYILLPLLAIACGAAHGEWQPAATGANSTAYTDAASIRRHGATARMRVLIDFARPPFDGNNLPYRSLTMENEYQCDEGRLRVLSIASHADGMGRGERPYTSDEVGEWEAITDTSIQKDLWKQACAKTALPRQQPKPAEAAPAQ
jgi:hypothetical protein